jgi:hypothetical protein
MPPVLLVVPVGLAVLLAAFAHLGAVLIDAEPAFQFLGAALLLGRLVPGMLCSRGPGRSGTFRLRGS